MGSAGRSIGLVCLILLSLLSADSGQSAWRAIGAGRLADLAAAVGENLAFEPRLTGGFLPRADKAPARSGAATAAGRSRRTTLIPSRPG